jgi:hypothetical protein
MFYFLGLLMITYDMMGHLLCGIARLCGKIGAHYWNTYSGFIWPSLHDSVTYDFFWASWFMVALAMIILYKKKTIIVELGSYDSSLDNRDCEADSNASTEGDLPTP